MTATRKPRRRAEPSVWCAERFDSIKAEWVFTDAMIPKSEKRFAEHEFDQRQWSPAFLRIAEYVRRQRPAQRRAKGK